MCKRWKLTFQFLPHPTVMEVLEQLMQPKQLFSEWLVCTNTMRTKWTQPCVSAWEWFSRRTLGGGEPPKQQQNKRNPCYFNSTFLSAHFIFLIFWSYIQIQCLILFNPFIIQIMIKNENTALSLVQDYLSLKCCSDLNEHFQLHSEAHDFQRYRGNPAHIRIYDIIREAESVRLLVRVAVQTEHISSSLEGKEQTFISSNLKRLAQMPSVKHRASAFKAVLSTNLSRKYANDLSEKAAVNMRQICKYAETRTFFQNILHTFFNGQEFSRIH